MARVGTNQGCLVDTCTEHAVHTTDVLVRVTRGTTTTVMYCSPGRAEYLTTRYSRSSLLAHPNAPVVERVQ
jgi:hypothetical protein